MRRLTILLCSLAALAGLFASSASAQTGGTSTSHSIKVAGATYNWDVSCETSAFGGSCTSPVLSVNIYNTGGVSNAIFVSLYASAISGCTFTITDTKNGAVIYRVGVNRNSVVETDLYRVYSTYVVHAQTCSNANGELEDY